MFEIRTVIPVAKDLHISVMDYDLVSADDVIGETVIDLENRFLTRYRATVGLPRSYCTSGVCRWRDARLPTHILADFCEKHMQTIPVFRSEDTVEVGQTTYTLADFGQCSFSLLLISADVKRRKSLCFFAGRFLLTAKLGLLKNSRTLLQLANILVLYSFFFKFVFCVCFTIFYCNALYSVV